HLSSLSNSPPSSAIYPLSLHDALPISDGLEPLGNGAFGDGFAEFWHFYIGGITGCCRIIRIGRGGLFSGLGLFFLLRFFLWLVLRVVGRWLGVFVADACVRVAGVDGGVLVCRVEE